MKTRHWIIILWAGLCLLAAAGGQQAWAEPSPAVPQADYSCDGIQGVTKAECLTLVAFYESTNGPSWLDNTGWLTGDSPCHWKFVTCEEGHVARLALADNNLTGTLPPEMAALERLRVLNLADNHIGGTLPPELGQLARMRDFFLDHNEFTGAIPPELSGMLDVEFLDLRSNNLEGTIPPALGDLPDVQWLYLAYNQLSGPIPPELGKLDRLHELWLEGNQLNGTIPPELGNMEALLRLVLCANDLSGPVPAEFSRLSWLKRLELQQTDLSGPLPRELVALDLDFFWFQDTDLCVPDDPAILVWLESIHTVQGTGVICADEEEEFRLYLPGIFW